ncbi:MAG: hypothetical protein ACYSWX_09210 [Planctomycetota bacterium]|jgi:hypothetical protein
MTIATLLASLLVATPLAQEIVPTEPRIALEVNDVSVVTYDVGDLTGAQELRDLRDSVVRDDIPQVVRRAALDRYVELLETRSVSTATEDLVGAIETFIDPPASSQLNKVVASGPGEITVAGSDVQHAWVESFLEASRGFEGLVDFQMRIYEVPVGRLDTLVQGRSGTILAAPDVAPFLEQLEEMGDADVLMVPRVLAHAGSASNIQAVEQTAYVKDYELTVLPDLQQEIADPIIDVLPTGVAIDLRAVPVGPDSLSVHVDFRYSVAERPFPTRTVRVGAAGNELTIQLPEVRVAKATARFDLAPGSAVVMATVDPGREDGEAPRDLLFVLQAARVEEVDVSPPPHSSDGEAQGR